MSWTGSSFYAVLWIRRQVGLEPCFVLRMTLAMEPQQMGFRLTGELGGGSDDRLISYLQVTRMTQYYTLGLLYAGREKNLDSHT